MLAAPQEQGGPGFDPHLVVLGLVSQLLAGLLFSSAVYRHQPRQLLQDLFGGAPASLQALRGAILSKIQNQAGAVYFVVGTLLLLAGFQRAGGPADWRVEALGALLLLAAMAAVLLLSRRFADGLLRRHLKDHLRATPFPFEEHIQLTREIGELFGVRSSPEDTLESYVARLRHALGLAEPAPRGPRRPGRYLSGGYGAPQETSLLDSE